MTGIPFARVGVAGGAGAGALLAFDAWRYTTGRVDTDVGGTPERSLVGTVMGQRHMIGFAISHFYQPRALWTARQAHSDALQSEAALFRRAGRPVGSDDGADAFKHALASAMLTYRLVTNMGMSPEAAAAFTTAAGDAHERDSHLAEPHRTNAGAMDTHNNSVGAAIGVETARAFPRLDEPEADRRLAAAVLAAIREGRAVVLDSPSRPPRSSVPADV